MNLHKLSVHHIAEGILNNTSTLDNLLIDALDLFMTPIRRFFFAYQNCILLAQAAIQL